MKIRNKQILDGKFGLLKDIVLMSFDDQNTGYKKMIKDGEADIKLTINGTEVDLKSYFIDLEKRIEEAIVEEGKKQVPKQIEEKFTDIQEFLFNTVELAKNWHNKLWNELYEEKE